MTQEKLYYQEPCDSIFIEVKGACIDIWKTIYTEPTHFKKREKHINDMENIRDNMMTIIALFSHDNLARLGDRLSDKANKSIRDRCLSVDALEARFFYPRCKNNKGEIR